MSYAEDFFRVNCWMLKLAGLWRPESRNRIIQNCYRIYAMIVFGFVNVWFTSTEFVSLFYTIKDQYAFIKNINFFLTHFMGAVKVVFWYYFGHRLRQIMSTLEDPKLRYNNYEEYQPGVISRKYQKIGCKYSLMFLLMAHATLTSSYIPPTFAVIKSIRFEQGLNSTNYLPDRLPYYSWMPFPYNTAGWYLFAIAYQAGPMFSYAYSIVGMDTLYMNIMNCIAGHVTIIQGAFASLRNRVGKSNRVVEAGLESKYMMDLMKCELGKIVQHLQIVFQASKDLENIHNIVTLCQVTATLFILCTSLYLISIAPPMSKQFFVEVVYMMAMSFQLFLYCWFGNEVTLKFQDLTEYVWENDWLATDTTFKKAMIFTMMRVKTPVYFTAGRLSKLTLSTFMSILKTSYSIFTLIQNTST